MSPLDGVLIQTLATMLEMFIGRVVSRKVKDTVSSIAVMRMFPDSEAELVFLSAA